MPSAYINKLAKETGKTKAELEKYWDEAKKAASEKFGTSEREFGDREYSYAVEIVKRRSGVGESIVVNFMHSEKLAKDFINEMIEDKEELPKPKEIEPEEVEEEGLEEEEMEEAGTRLIQMFNDFIEEYERTKDIAHSLMYIADEYRINLRDAYDAIYPYVSTRDRALMIKMKSYFYSNLVQ
jgi:hypothetical protein